MLKRFDGGLAALTLAAGAFVLYLGGAYPTIAPRDSADLAKAALTLGVAHPPGYPLYVLLGRAWIALLPFGDPAYRLNALSALAGAAAVAVVFILARRRAGFWAASAAALVLAFSAPLWKFSGLCEMYSLHALFIAALLALGEGARESLPMRARAGALLFGLGLVNHQSLILLAPALAWLWSGELRRHGVFFKSLAPQVAAAFVIGLAPYVFVWIKLGDMRLAWAVVTRAEYGTLTLSAGFGKPLSVPIAMGLMGHLAKGLAASVGLLLLTAPAGWLKLRGEGSRLGGALILAFLAFGPLFFLMTRFDLSGWVAKTVLETAFVAPTLALCVLGGIGLDRLGGLASVATAIAAAALAFGLNARTCPHRQDFAAYDYIRDLRRSLPAGSSVLIGGDTAIFGLRYFDAAAPSGKRVLISALEPDAGARLLKEGAGRPFYTLGLGLLSLRALGAVGGPFEAWPMGLVQRLLPMNSPAPTPIDSWAFYGLRPGAALDRGESYAHDIRLAYAFAHFLSGRLQEARGQATLENDLWAAALDPEDYQIRQGLEN